MSDRIISNSFDPRLATRQDMIGLMRDAEGFAKLRASRNDDGTYTLFATNRTSIWTSLGFHSKQRDTAREALSSWIQRNPGAGGRFESVGRATAAWNLSSGELEANKVLGAVHLLNSVAPEGRTGQAPQLARTRTDADSGSIDQHEEAEDDPPELPGSLQAPNDARARLVTREVDSDEDDDDEAGPHAGAGLQDRHGVDGHQDGGGGVPRRPDRSGPLEYHAPLPGAPPFRREAVLGTGTFGTVTLYTAPGYVPLAIKRPIDTPDRNASLRDRNAQREADAHMMASKGGRASHVVAYLGTARLDGELAVITPNMAGGSARKLIEAIHRAPDDQVSPGEKDRLQRLVLRDMVTGLAQVHANGTQVHRDVKPENFLVGDDGLVRIADFGAAAPEDEQRGARLTSGHTELYASPEQRRAGLQVHQAVDMARRDAQRPPRSGEAPQAREARLRSDLDRRLNAIQVTRPSDVYSLGVSAMQVLRHGTVDPVTFQVRGLDRNSPTGALIGRMTDNDPTRRPTAKQILRDPIFSDLDRDEPQLRSRLIQLSRSQAQDT